MILALTAALVVTNWQDKILDVPYGGDNQWQATLQLLRQDYENLERNRSVIQTPLKIGSKHFAHGLGTHSFSHIRVKSAEPIVRFQAQVGVDVNARTNGARPAGSVGFAVQTADKDLYRSAVLRTGQEPQTVDVQVPEVHVLDLLVDDGGDGPDCDHADWAEAQITLKGGKKMRLDELPMLEGVGARYPFTFQYGERDSDQLLPKWRMERNTEKVDDDRTRVTTTWQDPDSGLKLTWVAVRYADFSAIDWVLYLENTSSKDTGIVEDLQALDYTVDEPISHDAPYILHQTYGGPATPGDFAPSQVVVTPREPVTAGGAGGRSSSSSLPFFKIDKSNGALVLAIGWSGQWRANFACPDSKNLNVKAGLDLTHFLLRPGERVRSPRIVLLDHTGDSVEANNRFRAFVLKHYMAKRSGKTPLPIPFCNTCFTRGGGWLNECNAENQISLIKAYGKLGLEALLTDAGWFEGGWPEGAGNWTPRKDAYPQGMGPVAQAAKDNGMVYGLWFEPERVMSGTAFHKEHPDWVLDNGNPQDPTLLANFGLKEVQDHFFNIVKGFMDLPGFRVYRQDFNMGPLEWWRHADAPDRQGVTEMKYIEGLYAYWEHLAAAWPDALREECASGGNRIDIETLSRMHIHQKTDYWFDHDADQGHLYGLSQYLPNGVVVAHLVTLDDYSFRSEMASSMCLGWIADAADFDFVRGKALLKRYLDLRHLLNGDWYGLLPYTLKPTEWMASQFNRPDLGEGMVLAFRHAESPYPVAEVRLHALDPAATYEVKFETAGKVVRLKGAELMKALAIPISTRRGSELITYKKI